MKIPVGIGTERCHSFHAVPGCGTYTRRHPGQFI